MEAFLSLRFLKKNTRFALNQIKQLFLSNIMPAVIKLSAALHVKQPLTNYLTSIVSNVSRFLSGEALQLRNAFIFCSSYSKFFS